MVTFSAILKSNIERNINDTSLFNSESTGVYDILLRKYWKLIVPLCEK